MSGDTMTAMPETEIQCGWAVRIREENTDPESESFGTVTEWWEFFDLHETHPDGAVPMYVRTEAEAGNDLRLVLLAALAWLHEHDQEGHADLMDAAINKDELAQAIDRLGT